MTWPLIGRTLRLAFLLRVPIFTLTVLAALGPLALNSSLLGNLLDQGQGRTEWYLFTVSFAAFMLASTAVTTINITLHYGNDRFDQGASLGLSQKRPLLTFIFGCVAALILVVCVYRRTIPNQLVNALFLLLGFVAALVLVIRQSGSALSYGSKDYQASAALSGVSRLHIPICRAHLRRHLLL